MDRTPNAPLRLDSRAVAEATDFLGSDDHARATFERVAGLINGFQTPYGMELLATVDWVVQRSPEASASPEACLREIHEWPVNRQRKRKVMRPRHVAIAWRRLAEQGWFDGAAGPGNTARAPG